LAVPPRPAAEARSVRQREPEVSTRPEIERRLRSSPPKGVPVVAGSTPVPSFGDAEQAVVVTLGINPSSVEFLGKAKQLLSGVSARFVTLPEVGVDQLIDAPSPIIERVYEGCRRYFKNRPYHGWFDALNGQLEVLGASYYDGSAAHIDLAHWATDPVWGKLRPAARTDLLDDGRDSLPGNSVGPTWSLCF
jgi:hypothetical protein